MDTLGLYVQVPFCASKCSFCNFSSRVARSDVYDRYCHALAEEIDRLPQIYQSASVATDLMGSPVDTVYFGGGTPSLLGGDRLANIVADVHKRFRFAPVTEFTLEVTPGSADRNFLQRAVAIGVNRLSIGAQSFADAELRSVGRLHSAGDTRTLVQAARGEGFRNVSMDLIAGLPHQTELSWEASLQSVIALEPEHVSVYLFEIDEKSRLGSEVLRHGIRYHAGAVPDEDFVADAYNEGRRLLGQAGYVQYEISNFAFRDRESMHNRKYWRLKPYLGLGAGAHSFDGQSRWENAPSVEEYEDLLERGGEPIRVKQRLTPDAQLGEFFFLGLRQMEGIDLAGARVRWGQELIHPWEQKIASLQHDGWLVGSNEGVRLAEKSLLVSNEIFQEFIRV
jgi:putative oxygen-independent coproporphyrinogen III oxidase